MKKLIALFSAMLFIISLSSCVGSPSGNDSHTTTDNSETTTKAAAPMSESTSAPEETTNDDFVFDVKKATQLGSAESQIYGRIFVYYQDNHIAVLDSYNSLVCSFDAQNLAPTAAGNGKALISEDMNFDGHADLRILYRSDSLNSFYLCWMWDMPTKNYIFYQPLSNLPNLSFDINAKTITSLDKTSRTSATLATYVWQEGDLFPTAFNVINPERETEFASDDVDTQLSIADGITNATVILTCEKKSATHWMCRIENSGIVYLVSESFDEETLLHRFEFAGISPGTTTVILRYAVSWDVPYIAEKVLNITVNPDFTLSVVEIR